MDDMLIDSVMDDGVILSVFSDPDAPDPRDEENLGHMVCWHRNYVLGDRQVHMPINEHQILPLIAEEILGVDQTDEILEAVYEEHKRQPYQQIERAEEAALRDAIFERAVCLPLYLYDHSGLSIAVGPEAFEPFDSMGWDWGLVGFIYCTLDEARREFRDLPEGELRRQAKARLVAEVQLYDHYLRGDAFGYCLETEDGEVIDSCGGLYTAEELREVVPEEYRHLVDELNI